MEYPKTSFSHYLQHLKLKPHGAKVLYYNGEEKSNEVHEAVVDLPIGNKNLHQCADAIMHLRARYLFECKKYHQISFHFTNGFECSYSKWIKGFRVKVDGNTCSWIKTNAPQNNSRVLWEYLETVFSYSGTASLYKELIKPASLEEIQVGDVFIQPGFPGHAIIVVDMAMNPNSKEKFVMFAQSYMPAQELHILKNLNSPKQSPWYSVKDIKFGKLITPEWTFDLKDIRKFSKQRPKSIN